MNDELLPPLPALEVCDFFSGEWIARCTLPDTPLSVKPESKCIETNINYKMCWSPLITMNMLDREIDRPEFMNFAHSNGCPKCHLQTTSTKMLYHLADCYPLDTTEVSRDLAQPLMFTLDNTSLTVFRILERVLVKDVNLYALFVEMSDHSFQYILVEYVYTYTTDETIVNYRRVFYDEFSKALFIQLSGFPWRVLSED